MKKMSSGWQHLMLQSLYIFFPGLMVLLQMCRLPMLGALITAAQMVDFKLYRDFYGYSESCNDIILTI